ncbi:unnamed protein product [Ectocarpus sp. CCAP 1310/34]|nr:unnamed protein product [Ectocarpus sp. CCAP 1310/34]
MKRGVNEEDLFVDVGLIYSQQYLVVRIPGGYVLGISCV